MIPLAGAPGQQRGHIGLSHDTNTGRLEEDQQKGCSAEGMLLGGHPYTLQELEGCNEVSLGPSLLHNGRLGVLEEDTSEGHAVPRLC